MRKGRLSLENYDDFIQNPGQRYELSSRKLNEIISMHGFCKLWGHKKSKILEALSSIDLMHLRRSTLKDTSISSEAFLSIEEVKEDLVALEWQKCEVQSLQIVRMAADEHAMAGRDLQTVCVSSRSDQCRLPPEQKKRRVSKTKKIASTLASVSSSSDSQLVKDNQVSTAGSDLAVVPISGGDQ